MAGTGTLVFLDFAAFLLRGNLGLLNKEETPQGIFDPNSNFRFILYVSFDNRKDALGLELLEGLYEITQRKGLKNFDLIVRISSERQGTRWD